MPQKVNKRVRFDRVCKSLSFCISERTTCNLFHQVLGYLSVSDASKHDEIKSYICEIVERAWKSQKN